MKKILLLLFILPWCVAAHAQSFFKSMPKVNILPTFNAFDATTVPQPDSMYNAFRPIVNIAAYGEPGNILMAGAGVSYQHCKYNFITAKWYCQWSVSGLLWAGGSVAPKMPSEAISYGIMLGVFNNLIMVGPALNGNKLQATVAIGISLNN